MIVQNNGMSLLAVYDRTENGMSLLTVYDGTEQRYVPTDIVW